MCRTQQQHYYHYIIINARRKCIITLVRFARTFQGDEVCCYFYNIGSYVYVYYMEASDETLMMMVRAAKESMLSPCYYFLFASFFLLVSAPIGVLYKINIYDYTQSAYYKRRWGAAVVVLRWRECLLLPSNAQETDYCYYYCYKVDKRCLICVIKFKYCNLCICSELIYLLYYLYNIYFKFCHHVWAYASVYIFYI